jgi:uncharacterized protein YyaL (SSP411 family)
LTDTKILTSWNGLMIRGFADAGRILDTPGYIEAAEQAARFLLRKLRNDEGRLLRTYSRGQAKYNGYLDDYAFFADGLIALHQATGDREWLDAANEITSLQLKLFWDDTRGGFYFTSNDHQPLLARARQAHDGARPAGNSVAACNLIYLATERNEPEYLERAERTIQSVSDLLRDRPASAPRMGVAIAALLEAKQND